jgi:hypothetical protein
MPGKAAIISLENIQALSLALLLFTYLVLALSTAQIHYLETVHRVTIEKIFDQNVFGSTNADATAAIGFFLLFIGLTFRRSALARLVSAALFASAVATALTGSDWLRIAALAGTVPVVAGLVLYSSVRSRRLAVIDNADPKTMGEPLGRESKPVGIHLPSVGRVGLAFMLVIIAIEIGAIARWVTYPFMPTEMYGDLSWKFAGLESALFHSFGLLSPYLVVLIAFSFLYKWYIGDLLRKASRIFGGQKQSREPDSSNEPSNKPERLPGIDDSGRGRQVKGDGPVVASYARKSSILTIKKSYWIILAAALIIAPMVALYPHLPGINPAGSGVSTDEQYYVKWMSALRADGTATWTDAVGNAFTVNKGDRPLTLLLILALSNITGSQDLMVIRYLPVALAPMLVLATYSLLRFSLKSEETKVKLYASIGAIFAAFSPQIVVGEYAGLLANWLALIPTYFVFYFLIKGWDSASRNQMIRNFGILFGMLLLIMLLHLYTWAHMLTVTLLFAAISFLFARKSVTSPRIKVALMLIVVGSSFAIDYARSSFFETPAAGASDSAIGTNIVPHDTAGRWDRLFFTLHTNVGGFLSLPILLILALVWIVKADLSKTLNRIMLSMVFILAIPITFGSIEFQTRVLYNIPLHVFALLALSQTKYSLEKSRLIIPIAIALIIMTYSLRAMANLYIELPPGFVLDNQFLLP